MQKRKVRAEKTRTNSVFSSAIAQPCSSAIAIPVLSYISDKGKKPLVSETYCEYLFLNNTLFQLVKQWRFQ